ncbi:hypothetical protein ASZ78_012056, partial [Callipepla squamata]
PSEAVRAGGLLPEEWAGLFWERRELLWPVQRWLEDIFSQVPELRWWQITALEGAILTLLCQLGLDRDALVQHAQRSLSPITAPLIDGLIETVVSRCGREAWRMLGLQEPRTAQQQQREQRQREQQQQQREQQRGPAAPSGPTVALSAVPSGSPTAPDAEELPGTSSGALGGGCRRAPRRAQPWAAGAAGRRAGSRGGRSLGAGPQPQPLRSRPGREALGRRAPALHEEEGQQRPERFSALQEAAPPAPLAGLTHVS